MEAINLHTLDLVGASSGRHILDAQPRQITGTRSATESIRNMPLNVCLRRKPTTAQCYLLRPPGPPLLALKNSYRKKLSTVCRWYNAFSLLPERNEAENLDRWLSPEMETPISTGVSALCQSMLLYVNLYCFLSNYIVRSQRASRRLPYYSTVTDFARLRGWSTSVPLSTAT